MNQIELHPYHAQSKLIDFCRYREIAVTAYSPLGTPQYARTQGSQPILLQDETIGAIARRHNKLPAQVLIRWAIQRETVVIPKSITPERIKENMQVFNFELSEDDMKIISTLDQKHRFLDPAEWGWIPYFD